MNRRLIALLITLAASIALARYSAIVRRHAGCEYFLQAVTFMRPGSHVELTVGDW